MRSFSTSDTTKEQKRSFVKTEELKKKLKATLFEKNLLLIFRLKIFYLFLKKNLALTVEK